MFSSPVLDVVILLSFIYFTGSLILSTINEGIAGTFRLRPGQLQASLENLFFKDDWKTWVDNTLKCDPNIQSLMAKKDQYPSYIPAGNFALAVINQLRDAQYTAGGDLQGAITKSTLPADFKDVLGDLAVQANNDLTAFQKGVEDFYNSAMERAGGVYKRQIRWILLVLGFFCAATLNLDTIKIVQDELSNKAQLSHDVDNIAAQLPKISASKDSSETVSIKTGSGNIEVSRNRSLASTDTATKNDDHLKTVSELTMYLQQNSGFTLGYSADHGFKEEWFGSWSSFFKKFLGILITAFALQLSSGFWFDLMSKAVNVRAAGNKPQTNTTNNK